MAGSSFNFGEEGNHKGLPLLSILAEASPAEASAEGPPGKWV
jgi:hypothetical protein